MDLPPPDPRSLFPLASTELVEPPETIPWYATDYVNDTERDPAVGVNVTFSKYFYGLVMIS
jgi:hypothetical protein